MLGCAGPIPVLVAVFIRLTTSVALNGWGTWIRTKTNRVRVCCATVTPFPNGYPSSLKG
jgi:hypothetical protein